MRAMIKENVERILEELPHTVDLVAAAKSRTVEEISEAIEGGVRIVGENYVKEAEEVFRGIGKRVKWHFIGHLQRNKTGKAVRIFDMIETVDSLEIAREINRVCAQENKIMPVLIEINSGRERQKFGVSPEDAEGLIRQLSLFRHIKVRGVMTMGPYSGNPEDARPYFRQTREVFDRIKTLDLYGVEMKCISMGMSNSYRVAVEEGANMVRIGSRIFGDRVR